MSRDLKTYFTGSWALQRDIDDRRQGQSGHLVGQADFTPEKWGLLYRESGQMTLGASVTEAFRQYRYSFPRPGHVEIGFEDGRLLLALDLTDETATATHLCGADSYAAQVALLDETTWRATWHVTGPRKDYTLVSRYRRRPDEDRSRPRAVVIA